MDKKDVFMLERTKDSESFIIGFYNTEDRAVDAIKRVVNKMIDDGLQKAKTEGSVDHAGVYLSEGFLISRNHVEVDPTVAFEKIEDPTEFPQDDAYNKGDTLIKYHPAEDLGDVDGDHFNPEEQGEY